MGITQLAGERQTIAVWLFDEPKGLYPSAVLHDAGPEEQVMVLGRGGRMVRGRYGNGLQVVAPPPLELPEGDFNPQFGLGEHSLGEGRTVPPLVWENAHFTALMTGGENHLRKQVGFRSPTRTGLNLGNFDWTLEFWLRVDRDLEREGVVFEAGSGPRGENKLVTRLMLSADLSAFHFQNEPSGLRLNLAADPEVLRAGWSHVALVYEAEAGHLRLFINGRMTGEAQRVRLQPLPEGDEDYFTLGRDGLWERPLWATFDEMRFSRGIRYARTGFDPPPSFKGLYLPAPVERELIAGPPLLFGGEGKEEGRVLDLGGRKHLFIDDAIVERQERIRFAVNPPRVDRQVMKVEGSFRKHLTILEDDEGAIRLYTALADDYLGLFRSEDGVHFEAVETGIEHRGHRNIVIPEPVGMGTVFIDPNAPPEGRYKYISDYHRRGLFVYTSPDGITFKRHRQAVSPFRSGSQNDIFYDDQRQLYVGFHRSDYARTPGGSTLREFVMTETTDLLASWEYEPTSLEDLRRSEKTLHRITPWYLDNGPLTPGGWGIEYPTIFTWDPEMDPVTAGIYNPKALKYPWAPDTYVAFPIWYFHYYEGGPGRVALRYRRGGGPTETQFASSRDGVNWRRYPRPAYVDIGRYDGLDIRQTFIAQGLVKRGEELWQYVFLDNDYHTALERTRERRVYRLIQRFDGFVSAEGPYDGYGELVTRPLRFEGSRLVLNIATGAHGYATVALLDADFNPIPGYGHEEAVIINGDFMEAEAEWMEPGTDLSGLAGETVRVAFRLRGSRLYSMQFKPKEK